MHGTDLIECALILILFQVTIHNNVCGCRTQPLPVWASVSENIMYCYSKFYFSRYRYSDTPCSRNTFYSNTLHFRTTSFFPLYLTCHPHAYVCVCACMCACVCVCVCALGGGILFVYMYFLLRGSL